MNLSELEVQKIRFWNTEKIFDKSISQRKTATRFVFLEGPPTANGMPHPGHVLTRTYKDIVLRYKTMQGFLVERKAGWDTHGLPVELEVEKQLGLKNKKGIEEYGVREFNAKCRESVFKYEGVWRSMTERVGFWIDLEHPYITFDANYIESVWWSLNELFKKQLLYEGHKIVPLCPRCGTPLSSHEVALGYKEVTDKTVFVKFKSKKEDFYFLVWTTTPWTLYGNVALAISPKIEYALVESKGEKLVLARELVKKVCGEDAKILKTFSAKELAGMEYEQLLPSVKTDKKAFFVITAPFVSLEEGSGIVHQAPAFGEEDYEACKTHGLPVLQPIGEDGKFTGEVPELQGVFFKQADPKIMKNLDEQGLLYKTQDYLHSYPFCWRCDTPLMYYAAKSWFIRMTKLRDNLIANNKQVNWYPETIRDGRFGEFLENVKDWALSRSRYWGTPLPIWKCSTCGKNECFGSFAELKKRSLNFPATGFDPHKPIVDEIKLKCSCGGESRRVPEVIDCWYDSGAASFAQWHYPFENQEKFAQVFPTTFIVEAIDQTRGWFYTLLAISTALFDKPAYLNCVVLGHILDKNGVKMSKSKGNIVSPDEVIQKYGADSLRWALLTNNAPWEPTKFSEDSVKEAYNKYLSTVYNSLVYYQTYSRGLKFVASGRLHSDNVLDKWLISRANTLAKTVEREFTEYNTHKVCRAIQEFAVDDLSNWFIRRSRDRFNARELTLDSKAGFEALNYALKTLAKITAPFTPFIAEEIHQQLLAEGDKQSVHLENYPQGNDKLIDATLEHAMSEARAVIEAGRRLRAEKKLKTKQPLAKAILVLKEKPSAQLEQVLQIAREELNVKKLDFDTATDEYETSDFALLEYEEGNYLVLETTLTDELKAEGLANELVRNIQVARKLAGLQIFDEVSEVQISKKYDLPQELAEELAKQVRAKKIVFGKTDSKAVEAVVNGEKIKISVKK